MSRLRPYLAIWRMRMRTLLQYRVAAIAGVGTQWLFGLVMVSVLTAFYGESNAVQPMSLPETITYVWLGQAMLGLLAWGVDSEVADSIRTGGIAYDLTRPLAIYSHWYARVIAVRSAPTLLRAIPQFIIALFLLPRAISMTPPTLPALLAWALSTVGALMLTSAVTCFMQSTLFWTVTGTGILRIFPSFVTLFSGNIIPLPLFPDWMQTFLRYQPFAGIFDIPARLFCGTLPPGDVFPMLVVQLFWTGFFVLIGQWITTHGLRRVALAGG